MNPLTGYHQSQDLFDRTLDALPAAAYSRPSRCTGWSVADVVGHVTWGQDYVAHLARREEYAARGGAPGTRQAEAYLAGADPLTAWRTARTAADSLLSDDALQAPPPLGLARVPGTTLGTFLGILSFDFLIHAWDIGDPFGIAPVVPEDLLSMVEPIAHRAVSRSPGFFGPELTTPAGADRFTALLAFTGRGTPRPVPSTAAH